MILLLRLTGRAGEGAGRVALDCSVPDATGETGNEELDESMVATRNDHTRLEGLNKARVSQF